MNSGAVIDWIGKSGGSAVVTQSGTPDQRFAIVTLEGEMTAQIGDWIVQGIQGEFYPVRDTIFRATYDEVSQ
jgi:hypothetical protein